MANVPTGDFNNSELKDEASIQQTDISSSGANETDRLQVSFERGERIPSLSASAESFKANVNELRCPVEESISGIAFEPNDVSKCQLNRSEDLRLERSSIREQLDEIFAQAENRINCQTSQEQDGADASEYLTSDSDFEIDFSEIDGIPEMDAPPHIVREAYQLYAYRYSSFLKTLSLAMSSKPKLTFISNLANDEVFPSDLTLYGLEEAILYLPALNTLSIIPPDIEEFLKKEDLEKYFRLSIGDESFAQKIEEKLRDRVIFLLRSITAPKLEHFLLNNCDDRCKLWKYSDRFRIWETAILKFLAVHSSSLKSISITTSSTTLMTSLVVSRGNEKIFVEEALFPCLEELSVTLWENYNIPPHAIVSNHLCADWCDLLKSRALYGNLRKFVWASKINFSWDNMFIPIIRHNRASLETVHIAAAGDFVQYMSPSFKTVLNGSVFSDLPKLKSLYLKKPNCCLTNADCLPVSLEELYLDFIYFDTEELVKGLKRMTSLRKLIIVNSFPLNYDEDVSCSGVTEELIQVAMQQRQLEELSIIGHNLPVDQVKDKPVTKISLLAKIGRFIMKWLWKSKSPKQPGSSTKLFGSPDVSCFMEKLKKIGHVNDEQIVIGMT